MNLSRLAIRNSQFVIIVLLIGIVLSVRSFITMPRSEDPQITLPIYNVLAIYPGTDPEDMETLIVDPIEEVLEEIDDIDNIESFISESVARISIDAAYDIDSKDKYNEIVREINTIRSQLPEGIVRFEIDQIRPDDRVNFMVLAVTGEGVPYQHLYETAEELEDLVESVDGVKSGVIEAYPNEEIRVSLDYQRMSSQNVTLNQVIGILQSNNVNIPGGSINGGGRTFSIKSTGAYQAIKDIENTILTSRDNQVVYLKDVAHVYNSYEDDRWKARFNNDKCVFVSVKLKRGFNVIDVDEQLDARIKEFRESLNGVVDVNVSFEQASAVEGRINEFFVNLLQGIGLVGLVIFLALGWRSSVIIITLIPVCIVLSLAILNGAGYALQQISVASLVLALGLLVDNGIVVIENINRYITNGYTTKEASIKGPGEVGMAIVSSTITTLLSFFPLTQLGQGPGVFLRSLPLTVIFTLVISLILALSFSPIMSNWVLSNKTYRASRADKFFAWISSRAYRPMLESAIRFRWFVVLGAIVLTVLSVRLFPAIGISFFPTADKPMVLIDVETPTGSSIDVTDKIVREVEEELDTMDYVLNYTANTGYGNPQVYYNRFPSSAESNTGQLLVNFKYWDQERFYRTIGRIRSLFHNYPGAKITLEELKNGAPVQAPIEIRLIGDNLDSLKVMAAQVENVLINTEGVINITNPLRRGSIQLKFKFDKVRGGLFNVSQLDFDRTVRASFNGLAIDKIKLEDDEDYNLVIRMPYEESPSLEDFYKIYVANRLGAAIPLHHVSDLKFEAGLSSFRHYDLKRYVGVTGSLNNLDNTIGKTVEIMRELEEMKLPQGCTYMIGGEYEEQQSTFGSLAIILILAQVGIFAVLVLQFRSVRQPFIVFAAIPLAISGSFIALYATGWPFSFFAFVGLISLIGIVVNNSIILVDYTNQLRKGGMSIDEAVIEGAATRLKPIVLTTLTTILGLVPLTLQATNQWSPLCWTIIGGMISSTILTLFVVPILYKWWSSEHIITD